MLPQLNRINQAAEFRRVMRNGKKRAGRYSVYYVLNGEGVSKAGFVVSKAAGNAVTRNRIKRRYRELARKFISQNPNGTLLVIRAKPDARHASWDGLSNEFSEVKKDLR